ncbi:MAG: iron-sulfur cluster-binding protein [Fimbriimonadaceae bacterium]|nr:iron-sulfur cluster-binding protein [Fimbriimonadaceae bacterium]
MKGSRVEKFAEALDQGTTKAVRSASVAKTTGRLQTLSAVFDGDIESARAYAAQVKEYVLDDLYDLLLEFEKSCTANGITVHWAKDAESARKIILDIVEKSTDKESPIVKAKSMATEEIHLNHALEEAGYHPIETDLGEFVVQLDGDTPSHIVTPIIHKTKEQVAETFAHHRIGPPSENAEELTLQARDHLRGKFQQAKVGISGVNFGIAKTGRIVLVENEGNNRLSTTAPDVHIALMGIEKLLVSEDQLPIFLKILGGSATGQRLTTYVHLISGPRKADEQDGPKEIHLVLLDNGRSRILNGPYKDILRCIRCGACLNVCPVYRQASGHGYGHVYSGPLGAVLAPALEGVKGMGDLAQASSLCGACEEVCPVKIPIPHLLLKLRHEAVQKGAKDSGIPWQWFGMAAEDSKKWKAGLALLPLAGGLPNPATKGWDEHRSRPEKQGRDFRRWWRGRA